MSLNSYFIFKSMDLQDFMSCVAHDLTKAEFDILPLIQNFNGTAVRIAKQSGYYNEDELKKDFIRIVTNALEKRDETINIADMGRYYWLTYQGKEVA